MIRIEDLAHRINARRVGDRWRGRCPVHGGKSLVIGLGNDRVLLKCMAGCETEDVIEALGLEWSDVNPHRATFDHWTPPVKLSSETRAMAAPVKARLRKVHRIEQQLRWITTWPKQAPPSTTAHLSQEQRAELDAWCGEVDGAR